MSTASREFQIMVKPIGPVCNLDCHYCYYLEKTELYPKGESYRMPNNVLESYIVQHIAASPKELIYFSWHGGEPTALGIDYFRKIVELQRKHLPEGRRTINGIQTNGTLLDEDWARFLAQEQFDVGLSLDGPKEFHDDYRVTKGGGNTHKQVVQAFRLLQRHNIQYSVLCVVNNHNVHYPLAVYRFFKNLGVRYLQFLPIVLRRPDGTLAPESVPSEPYGRFLSEIFDEWIRNDVGRIGMQNFEEAARPLLGREHVLCIFRETCGDVLAMEHNGDLFSCDHFVNRANFLGNVMQTPLVEMLESEQQRGFGRAKRDTLPRYCRGCEVLDMCNGGCPKDRFINTPDGEAGLNYLCAGYKKFFTHSRPYLAQLARFWQLGQSLDGLMELVRAGDAVASTQAGRNDPCPCGSGKKYKKCCMGKPQRV
ncbi:MAG: anaerobic sulfatase maturase [Acidobacteria bacterium]|nr:anaerobic sulfatase maturase [Acidobacteriota bacterium]